MARLSSILPASHIMSVAIGLSQERILAQRTSALPAAIASALLCVQQTALQGLPPDRAMALLSFMAIVISKLSRKSRL